MQRYGGGFVVQHHPRPLPIKNKKMGNEILSELHKIKQLTLLGSKDVFTMSDCALYTGLSKSHLYKMVCAKKIPYFKSNGGKLTYFDKDEVKAWCLQHRVKTSSEIEQEAANYTVLGKRKGVVV